MLIMDGRSLQTQPIVAIRRVQNFLRVSDSIPSKAFNFNNTIGLFCLHLKYITMEDRVECPDRTDFLREFDYYNLKKLINYLVPINYPEVTGEVRNQLKEFFAPHMAAFAHMANETFHWAFDNMQTQTMPEIMP